MLGCPDGLLDDSLPEDVEVRVDLRGSKPLDVVVLCCTDQKTLADRFEKARARLTPAGGLWIGWPKKASGVETDLSDAIVRAFGLETGMVDNKTCAIDETWSGLRFVTRLRDR